jgi:phage-related baseplate assembly protein
MADFGFTRLPSSFAVGNVTFSRHSALINVTILPGTLVKTSDNTQAFCVVADALNGAWSTQAGGYVLASGTTSIEVPVIAQTAGSTGNVLPRKITVISSALAGVDLVTNQLATMNGQDAETDLTARKRFVLFINSRSKATISSVETAISGVQQGLSYYVSENTDCSNEYCPGSFVVTVDDGSGNPSAALLSAVSVAVDAIRPVGSVFSVRPPVVQPVTLSFSVLLSADANQAAVLAAVENAVTLYINGLSIGAPLPITRIAQVAYDSDPRVLNVTGLTLNGASSDLTPTVSELIKLASLSVIV